MVDTVSSATGRIIAGGLLAVGLLLIAPFSLIARGGQHRDWPVYGGAPDQSQER